MVHGCILHICNSLLSSPSPALELKATIIPVTGSLVPQHKAGLPLVQL